MCKSHARVTKPSAPRAPGGVLKPGVLCRRCSLFQGSSLCIRYTYTHTPLSRSRSSLSLRDENSIRTTERPHTHTHQQCTREYLSCRLEIPIVLRVIFQHTHTDTHEKPCLWCVTRVQQQESVNSVSAVCVSPEMLVRRASVCFVLCHSAIAEEPSWSHSRLSQPWSWVSTNVARFVAGSRCFGLRRANTVQRHGSAT